MGTAIPSTASNDVVSPAGGDHTAFCEPVDLKKFLAEFQDYLAPRLDTYEQSIYLYVFRHSRMLGKNEVVIGFKSARRRMACGIGEKGKPMAEGTAYEKLRSLETKGCINIIASEWSGNRIRLNIPSEIPGLIPSTVIPSAPILEEMDFFTDPDNRLRILEREAHRCFYCLRALDKNNYVIEHMVSRPQGDNSYRNVVAACRTCNNRKNEEDAEDFLRTLYREKFLSDSELADRLSHLERLKNGELQPIIIQ